MGTDLGLALSLAADANSGLQGNNSFGDIIAGGGKLPKWFLPVTVGALAIVAIIYLVRR